MSIKTNELQTITAPALTDTLLLANSAEGTAQLSLAQAAAFFGTELVKPANPVGAALSNKADLSVQETVEKTAVPSRNVTVTAAELPGYIKTLPRLLTEQLVVTVEQGTVPCGLELEGLYGPGYLAVGGNDSIVNGGIKIGRCGVYVQLNHFDVRGANTVSNSQYAVYSEFSNNVVLSKLTIDGEQNAVGSAVLTGIRCNNCGMTVIDGTQVSNTQIAVLVAGASVAAVKSLSGSGNHTGAYAYRGGVILLGGTTPPLLGGTANIKDGGIIVKSDGTLL